MAQDDRNDGGDKPGRGAPGQPDHADADASHGAETSTGPDPHPNAARPTGQAGTGQSGGAAPAPRRQSC